MSNATERAILKELRETRLTVEMVLHAVAGDKWTHAFLREVEERVERHLPYCSTGILNSALGLPWEQLRALEENAGRTLEEIAANPRAKVAGIRGVGDATLRALDAKLAENRMTWAEVA